jgi:hypothetical protein
LGIIVHARHALKMGLEGTPGWDDNPENKKGATLNLPVAPG